MIYYSSEARKSHILRIGRLKSKLFNCDTLGYLETRELIQYLSLLVEQIEKEDRLTSSKESATMPPERR